MSCERCAGADAETHTTEEHDEDWVNNADPCGDCGAGEHEPCKPGCPQGEL